MTNWASPYAIDKIKATLRSAKGVKTMLRCTGNPGGPGHSWVKSRYVDPALPLTLHIHKIKLLDGTVAIRKRVSGQLTCLQALEIQISAVDSSTLSHAGPL